MRFFYRICKPETSEKSVKMEAISLVLSQLTIFEKRRFGLILVGQFFTSILELFALATTGVVISLAIRTSDGEGPGERVLALLSNLGLQDLPSSQLILVMSLISLAVFVLRTVASIWFVKKTLKFSGFMAARVSSILAQYLILNPRAISRLNNNEQELSYAVSGGTVRLVSGVVGALSMFVADLFLLSIVMFGLFVVDPKSSLIMFSYFLFLALSLQLLTKSQLHINSRRGTEVSIDSSHYFLESLNLFREFNLRHLLVDRIKTFSDYRNSLSTTQANLQFIQLLSKYVLEVGLILGISVVALVQILSADFSRSAATFALFVVAGSRLGPGIFRLQQNLASLEGTIEATSRTQDVIRDLKNYGDEFDRFLLRKTSRDERTGDFEYRTNSFGQGIHVQVSNLFFSFDESNVDTTKKARFLHRDLSIDLAPGTTSALLGNSGQGKSTLVDLLIGAKKRTKGQILFDGIDNENFISSNPGRVAFVPQSPILLQGSLAYNISLKNSNSTRDKERIQELLNELGLSDLLRSLPEGIESDFNFARRKLSGGQLQRVALARAMYSNPRLLIVDEYTSSLDNVSEVVVTNFVKRISSNCTVLIVSHRDNSIFDCDNYFVLRSGLVKSFPTLELAREYQFS